MDNCRRQNQYMFGTINRHRLGSRMTQIVSTINRESQKSHSTSFMGLAILPGTQVRFVSLRICYREPELLEASFKQNSHIVHVGWVPKEETEIVRVANKICLAVKLRLDLLLEPQIQHIMEVDVPASMTPAFNHASISFRTRSSPIRLRKSPSYSWLRLPKKS